MKKIGIVTLVDYKNYGNRLQAFAVQKTYKTLGFESEIIRYRKRPFKEPLFIRLKIVVKYILFLSANLSKLSLHNLRLANFQKHSKKHLSESSKYVDPLSIDRQFHTKYSYLSVGSDQIWGWFNYDVADFVFLKFVPREKRLTFSPSFGSATIDEKYRKVFTDGLLGFEQLSVREESGAEIVKSFIGKEATVLCDPTMCLSKKEWLEFATPHHRRPQKKFILTYFLGEKSEKVEGVLEAFSKEYDIVNLNSFKSPEFYAINPSEWVDYINDASLFLTDSFHGVVFSLILQTPFVVYSRVGGEGMETRITNILEKFKMGDRFEMSADESLLFNIDFSDTENSINTEKLKAFGFLRKSLNS